VEYPLPYCRTVISDSIIIFIFPSSGSDRTFASMDATGLALGIVALYTTCRDCYDFYLTVKHAEAESSVHLRELKIQQSILKAWGFHWEIYEGESKMPKLPNRIAPNQSKLHKYLSINHFKAEGVFNALSALADTLSNQEKLVKRYGIELRSVQTLHDESQSTDNVKSAISNPTLADVKPVVNELKSRLSILNKFKWALKDKELFKSFVMDLRLHSDVLYRLCPEYAFDSMNFYLTMECLAGQESPVALKRTSEIATQQAEVDIKSSVRNGYKLLASTATLKASINENRDRGHAEDEALTSVDGKEEEMKYLGKGLALFKGEVVYV